MNWEFLRNYAYQFLSNINEKFQSSSRAHLRFPLNGWEFLPKSNYIFLMIFPKVEHIFERILKIASKIVRNSGTL